MKSAELIFYVLSQALASISDQTVALVDPTYQEAKHANGIITLACMPAMSSATNISFSGSASRAVVKEVGSLSLNVVLAAKHSFLRAIYL